MTDTMNDTQLKAAIDRVAFARMLAKDLMQFPMQPRPGDDPNEYYKYLEVAFTSRITEILNNLALSAVGPDVEALKEIFTKRYGEKNVSEETKIHAIMIADDVIDYLSERGLLAQPAPDNAGATDWRETRGILKEFAQPGSGCDVKTEAEQPTLRLDPPFIIERGVWYDEQKLVLVPREPTEEMLHVGTDELQNSQNTAYLVYKAMISAAIKEGK